MTDEKNSQDNVLDENSIDNAPTEQVQVERMSEELSDDDLNNVAGGAAPKAKLFVRKQGTEQHD